MNIRYTFMYIYVNSIKLYNIPILIFIKYSYPDKQLLLHRCPAGYTAKDSCRGPKV